MTTRMPGSRLLPIWTRASFLRHSQNQELQTSSQKASSNTGSSAWFLFPSSTSSSIPHLADWPATSSEHMGSIKSSNLKTSQGIQRFSKHLKPPGVPRLIANRTKFKALSDLNLFLEKKTVREKVTRKLLGARIRSIDLARPHCTKFLRRLAKLFTKFLTNECLQDLQAIMSNDSAWVWVLDPTSVPSVNSTRTVKNGDSCVLVAIG